MFIEILVAIAAISFVVIIFSRYIYKRYKGIDDECEVCKKRLNNGLKKIRKELNKEMK